MKGDFSRVTFDPLRHFSRVLRQQGRVDLDADSNEQVALFWHYLRRLAADLIGPHGGPEGGCAFGVAGSLEGLALGDLVLSDDEKAALELGEQGDFLLSHGHYYVDGILCEVERPVRYCNQPFLKDVPPLNNNEIYQLYLDVWERHVSYLQDDRIREVALGGPDTSTRAQVVWQVRAVSSSDIGSNDWPDPVEEWQPRNRGLFRVRARLPQGAALGEPCITSPEARYRGLENQLYRVEIHRGGEPRQGETNKCATFKWSRENGSVAFPIRDLQNNLVTLELLNAGDRLGLKVRDRVEVTDDDRVFNGEPGILAEVEAVEPLDAIVTLEVGQDDLPKYEQDDPSHPVLRRWDHRPGDPSRGGPELGDDGALVVVENEDLWIPLEDGIEIQFASPPIRGEGNIYRSGDYWWFAARTVTGDVEWPGVPNGPQALPPHGVVHHYAPLGIIGHDGDGVAFVDGEDRRRKFKDLCELSTAKGA